jgi:precorrin-6B methylase 2
MAEEVWPRVGGRVARGLCAGLAYPADLLPHVDAPVAKLVGSYEEEIAGAIAAVLDSGVERLIDVGAAEGYYAVGLALRSPRLRVDAFEIDPVVRSRCARLARVNGVESRVVTHARADGRIFRGLDTAGAFLISDCEGAEARIFGTGAATYLRAATLLIEVHEAAEGQTALLDALVERFASSHRARVIPNARRRAAAFPELAGYEPAQQDRALSENRPCVQRWLLLEPLPSRH